MPYQRLSVALVPAALASLLAAGCVAQADTRLATTPPAAPANPAPLIISDNGGGILSANGTGLVSEKGAGLLDGRGSRAIGSDTVSADAAGVLARPGAAVVGRCALPPAGTAGVSLALVTMDGFPVLAPGGKAPLACTPDAQGAFRFDGVALRGELLVLATLGPGRGQLLALATPDGVSRCDLPGTLAVLSLLAVAPAPDWTAAPLPLATFKALADALAALPVPQLEALGTTPEAVRAALDALRPSSPAVDAALKGVDTALQASPADGVIGHIQDGAAP